MKKQTLGIRAPVWTLAFCLFALVFASCGEPGDPAKAQPLTPDTRKLSFKNVVIEYQKDSETELVNGFVFSKTKFTPSFEAEHDKAQNGYHINIAITAPDEVAINWKLSDDIKKSFKKPRIETTNNEGKKVWIDGSAEAITLPESPESIADLPVPRLDPLYDVFLQSSDSNYSEIKLTFELTLKDSASRKFIDPGDGLEYEWEDSTYVLTIKEQDPGKKTFTDEEKGLIDQKIEDAEKAIKAFEILVGNPALDTAGGDNDSEAVAISEIMDELVVLKEGLTEYMYIETATLPDGDPVGSTEPDADPASNLAVLEALTDKDGKQTGGWCYYGKNSASQDVYMVKQAYQTYDTPMILYKATELNTRLTEYIAFCTSIGRSPRLVVKKLRLEYLTAEQAGAGNPDRVQNVSIASEGKYSIELVGGSGGHVWTGSHMTTTGGKAARVVATYKFSAAPGQRKFGFRIGGEGIGTADLAILNDPANNTGTPDQIRAKKFNALKAKWINAATWVSPKAGGWNGGGTGGSAVNDNYKFAPGSGGGGASDVRIYKADESGFNGDIDFNPAADARLMVAAGGGGSAQGMGTGIWRAVMGGHAGVAGQLYNAGRRIGTESTVEVVSDTGFTYIPWGEDPMPPGTPNYQKADSPNGSDGGNGSNNNYTEGRGGGGGGFKGGEAISVPVFKAYNATGSGAGGSSHFRAGFESKPAPIRTLYDKYGNGYAIIEWKDK